MRNRVRSREGSWHRAVTLPTRAAVAAAPCTALGSGLGGQSAWEHSLLGSDWRDAEAGSAYCVPPDACQLTAVVRTGTVLQKVVVHEL